MRMSPERPPSQDSGGGSIVTQVIEPQNMVLSTLSPESSHIITTVPQSGQQHRIITTNQQQPTQQIIVNGNSYATVHSSSSPQNSNNTIVGGIQHHHRLKAATAATSFTSSISNSSSPKYVVFHQNGTSQYATVTSEPTSATTYITATQQQSAQHQTNGVGNIVVLATEPLDAGHHHIKRISGIGGPTSNSNGTSDEDLTSLSWLHDKNLINNIVSYSNKSATTSPVRQSTNANNSSSGILSPTSDFLEDSCISEDNASSANSSSDQGISVHSSDFSPIQNTNNGFGGIHHHQQQQTNQFQSNYPVHHHIQYTNGNANNNNNSTNKNRNQLLSPSSSSSSTSSQHSSIHHEATTTTLNGATVNLNSSTGATTTVHVGPSGTTTVVEYKAGSNFIPSPRHQQPVPSSPQRTSPSSASTIVVHHTTNQTPSSSSSSSVISSTSTPTTTTYHQQHFHKKYLREQMNGGGGGFEQNNFEGGVTGGNRTTTTIVNNTVNVERDQISPINSSSNQRQTITLPATNQSISTGGEITYSTPVKSLPITTSHSTTNGQHDDLIKEGINFESSPQNNNSGSSSSSKMQSSKHQTAPSPKQKHPTNLPYDPQVHTHNKPPYSFSSLIFMAIEDSPEKALPVKEIYAWIVQHFPYFKTAPTGWKNSVRHNLSLNKSFLKVEKAPNMGKGSLWRVEQNQRPNLIQALSRSPFFPCAAIDKLSPQLKSPTSSSSTPHHRSSNSSTAAGGGGSVTDGSSSPDTTPMKSLDAKLFPKLSKMIKEMVNKGNYNNTSSSGGSGSESTIDQDECNRDHQQVQQQITCGGDVMQTSNGAGGGGSSCNGNGMMVPNYETIERLARDCGADNDDVNAAAAMLALKHGPKVFSETFPNGSPVITSSPSEDHTYSAGNGGTSTGNNSNNTSENNSNCNSSDGVYDSREGSPFHHQQHQHNHHQQQQQQQQQQQEQEQHITPEELEEQRRHAEGVDALLSFASKVSSMSSSAASSPMKRPSSTSPGIEDEHISSYAENIPSLGTSASKSEDDVAMTNGMVIMTPATMTSNQRQAPFNPEGYYHLLSPSPAKKMKTSRNLRTKIKRKATWIR